jgi:hypothetical protein
LFFIFQSAFYLCLSTSDRCHPLTSNIRWIAPPRFIGFPTLPTNENRFNRLCSNRRSVDDFVILEIIASVSTNESDFVFYFLSKMGSISPKLSKDQISESVGHRKQTTFCYVLLQFLSMITDTLHHTMHLYRMPRLLPTVWNV